MEDPKVRIKNAEIPFFILKALAFDGAQVIVLPLFALPFIGMVLAVIIPFLITIAAFISFSLLFAIKKVNYFSGKKAAMKVLILFGSLAVELLPFVTGLPAITGGVALMIFASRIEDTVGKKGRLERLVRRKERETRRAAFWGGAVGGALSSAGFKDQGRQVNDAFVTAQEKRNTQKANMYAARAYQGRRDISRNDLEAKTGVGDMQRLGGVMNRAWTKGGPERQRKAEALQKMYDVVPRRKMSESRRLWLERYNKKLDSVVRPPLPPENIQ